MLHIVCSQAKVGLGCATQQPLRRKFWQASGKVEPLLCSISKTQSCPAESLKCRALSHSLGHATEDAGIATFCSPAQKVQESFMQHVSDRNLLVSQLPVYSFHGLCVHWSPFLFHFGLYANVMSLLTMLVTLNPPCYSFIGCSSLLQGAA